MSIRRHEPVPASTMDRRSRRNTICETLRRVYRQTSDPEVKVQLRVAVSMAKSMTAKLQEYKRNWDAGFFSKEHSSSNQRAIDVLMLCYDDNANTMYRFSQCVRMLGLNVVVLKGRRHPFGYPFQAPVLPELSHPPISAAPLTIMAPGLEDLINNAHVVHLGASTYPMASVDWRNINVVVQHGGTAYRKNPAACNAVFNQFANKTIVQTPDLLGLKGSKNETLIVFPVNELNHIPNFEDRGDVPIVGHFPSNPDVKGTQVIEKVIEELHMRGLVFSYKGDTARVGWAENLERMSACDIIIDGVAPEQGGAPYGAFGNQTLEAAARGCAVITHNLFLDRYLEVYPDFGPMVANDGQALAQALETLITDSQALGAARKRCHAWAVGNHGMRPTANRLWDEVYTNFFE